MYSDGAGADTPRAVFQFASFAALVSGGGANRSEPGGPGNGSTGGAPGEGGKGGTPQEGGLPPGGGGFPGGRVAGVPEPAAWAMMLLGLGAIGGLARKRRARALEVQRYSVSPSSFSSSRQCRSAAAAL